MNNPESESIAQRAELIYEQRLKSQLEQSHQNQFIAIEPISGDYFLGETLSEAIGAARKEHPERLSHALRIGHRTAVHFGASL